MRYFIPVALIVLLLGNTSSRAEPPAGYRLQVIEMDQAGVVLELRLSGYELETRQHDGVRYQAITVPGLYSMTEPGQPQLPGVARLLGTPPGGIAAVRVLESESDTLDGVRLFPTPAPELGVADEQPIETFAFDAALYQTDELFPDRPAQVGLTGKLRDQAVAQVLLHPFQYNPVRQELKVYRRLRVQVLFAPVTGAQTHIPADPTPTISTATPYDEIVERSLLNSDALPPAGPARPGALSRRASTQATAPALKIFIEQDGLYKISYADVESAGFDTSGADPRHFRLSSGGAAVAMRVRGEGDGSFDAGDWLEFYGTAMATEFTTRNVYWLTIGESAGLRMASRDVTPSGGSPTPTAFFATLHLEENHEYWPDMPNGEGKDHWYWERFPSPSHFSSYSFPLANIAPVLDDGKMEARLHGRTSTSADPDHHTQIFLNGTLPSNLIDDEWWDGEAPFTHTIIYSQTHLVNGANTLTVVTPGDTGAVVDGIYVNSFDVGYWDTYIAENDQLVFGAPEPITYTFVVSGFSSSDIRVYDIGDPSRPALLYNRVVEPQSGGYRVRLEDEAAPDARYLALTEGQKRTPAGLLLDTPSTWRSPTNGADYVIITHEDFATAVAPLAAYRAGKGLRVATAQITDVYDEFSAGVFDPGAIRDFLSYAYDNWTPPAPLYVLLVGDANYDYQDFLGNGNPNFVPTAFFESSIIFQTTTDNWFVSVSGDDPLPDMLLGRLSVRTLAQAETVVDKILAYEQGAATAEWHRNTVFVTDDGSGFELSSDLLISALPSYYTAQRIYATEFTQPHDPTPGIVSAVDQGASIINYVGHGAVGSWGSWPGGVIFDTFDVPLLDNGPQYPFLVTGNCKNGLFAYPTGADAFAEAFVNSDGGGAIGAWSPTGLGYPSWHESMAQHLFQAVYGDSIYGLGAATTSAKIAGFAELGRSEPVEIFTLFGDPAMPLHVTQAGLNLNKTVTPAVVHPGELLTYVLTFANFGDYQAEDVVLTEDYDPRTIYEDAVPAPTTSDNIWQIGTLLPGASGTITVTVRVSPAVTDGATLQSTAIISATELAAKTARSSAVVEFYRAFLPVVLGD